MKKVIRPMMMTLSSLICCLQAQANICGEVIRATDVTQSVLTIPDSVQDYLLDFGDHPEFEGKLLICVENGREYLVVKIKGQRPYAVLSTVPKKY